METNSNNAKSPLKGIVIALSVVAAILLGVLIYIWVDRNALIDDLTIEKDQLTEQLGELQMDYQNLSSNNDSINVELAREREKVEQLIERDTADILHAVFHGLFREISCTNLLL